MADDSSAQRIARLTPLSEILALIEARVRAVPPQKMRSADVEGHIIAEDVVAAMLPRRAIALRDGYAVSAEAIAGAGPYAPLPFASLPPRLDVGEALPDGADAVLPSDAVNTAGGRAEALAEISPGEGVLVAGADATKQVPLRRAGARARTIDVAAFLAAGVAAVSVREPRITVALGGADDQAVVTAAVAMVIRGILAGGCRRADAPITLEAALADSQADAVIAVGGTGTGRHDHAIEILARLGRVDAHGLAISPGETAAFGFLGERPVLLIPGRLDAAVAVWHLIGRHLVAKLAGRVAEDDVRPLPLKRKITSTIGMTELVPVRCADGMAEPLASGYLSFTTLVQSDGWITVPADSEGFGAGTQVAVRTWL